MIAKENKGITLIALVVTIIVLLILAGVSITMITGQNGILNRAKEAKENTELAQSEEDEKMQGYENSIEKYAYGVPEGLKVGEEVTYLPSGTYNWQAKYCSTTQTDDVNLSSASGESFNLTKWRVLSIENGKVELVPTKPTEGTVYLGEAQGYNNGVKLLNDACSNLYGNESKGITARSLNIEDIEKYMDEGKLTEVHEYENTSGGAKYQTQSSNVYTSNKNYPLIYAKENLSVINGEGAKRDGLSKSQQKSFIEKNDNGATDGKITKATSIQPYQTYWMKENSYMQTAFRTIKGGTTSYYDILVPRGSSSYYWLSSRCIETYSDTCFFGVHNIFGGSVNANSMFDSEDRNNYNSFALFPVVSLNASLISGDLTNGFTVK